jgi:hypothetical protein
VGAAVAVSGVQTPRVMWVPGFVSSAGAEAVELCAMAGLHLDPWQALVLTNALGERPDGKWAAFEVGVNVARQNGKDAILEARELTGLFLLGERMIIHSAHMFDTSLEHFRRLLELIEGTPDFDRRVKRVSRSHGEEGIELRGGQRIRFRTRTKGGGRGFSGDLVMLNEAMDLPEASIGALMPTMAARSMTGNPQVWYAGSAVDQQVHEHGVVFARIRERGLRGGDPSLAYFEHSAEAVGDDGKALLPDEVPAVLLEDEQAWAEANPGLGIRISAEHVANELRSMDGRTFAVERMGIGDWPATGGSGGVIDVGRWDALADPGSRMVDPVCFSLDVRPDRSVATIGVAGLRADGLPHVEVVERRRGTGWVVGRIVELVGRHRPSGVFVDNQGPAGSLIADLERAGVSVTTVNATEHARACGNLFDLVEQGGLRHLGTGELREAVRGAKTRPLGDAWAWARSKSSVDISPLVAVTLALIGVGEPAEEEAVFASW